MNPKASVFVPKFGTSAKPATPPASDQPASPQPTPQQQPEEVQVQTPPTEKSWDSEDAVEKPTKKAPAKEEKEPEFTEEQIAAELKRMELEEKSDMMDTSAPVAEIDDLREHINIVFIGHVDAGKSTISGQILLLTGQVDDRLIQKYEREAKEKNRESWYLAYVMDTNEEERAKGKTVEVGRAHFETASKRYTILDAPGHKNYVPNMIGGAAQADIGVLVISARKGEFETGFHKGGQTREHAMLAKTLGLKYLIIVINKMDDNSVGAVPWAKERYDEIVGELSPFLRTVGYNPKTDVAFIPISGLKGTNIKTTVDKSVCPWYSGLSLLDHLDQLKPLERLEHFPFRLPIMDKFRESGLTQVLGKVETGTVSKLAQLIIMPNKTPVEIKDILIDDSRPAKIARPGENIRVSLKGVDEEAVHRGYVLCDPKAPIPCQAKFEAQLAILELLPHKSVFSAGYTAVIHIHTAVEECTITILIEQIDKKTGGVLKKKPKFVTMGSLVRCMIECAQPVCLELFSDVPQLGRFTLRDEGKTIAIGKVTALGPKKKPVAQQ